MLPNFEIAFVGPRAQRVRSSLFINARKEQAMVVPVSQCFTSASLAASCCRSMSI
jgi:hypothetical protein